MARVLTVTPNAALDVWTTTPRLSGGPKLRCSAATLYAGGGGIKVSRVLDRLGGETTALYAAGGWKGGPMRTRCAWRSPLPPSPC